jgi:hypothetical protein
MIKNIICCFLIFVFCAISFYCRGQAPAATLKFPDNKNVVEIPFTRYRKWIIINVSVNGTRERPFILDTGAPIAVLADAGLKDELKLNIAGNVIVGGVDVSKPKQVPLAASVKFKIGDIIIEDGLMAVGAATEVIDGVDGIIGKYLFDDAVVMVDWKNNKLILTRPDKFQYTGNGETLPIHLLPSGHIYAEISVEKNGKKVAVKSDVDLGNRSNFYIDNEKGSPLVVNEKVIPNIIVSWGANGPTYGDITRTNLMLGSFRIDNVITSISQVNKALVQDGLEANIGLSILERFTPIFDYKHGKLILEKNEKFPSAFTFNRSGIILNPKRMGDSFLIADIIPSSPAKEKGLAIGDKITSINGKKVSSMSSSVIDDLINGKTGNVLNLVLLRNGKEVRALLKMRDII